MAGRSSTCLCGLSAANQQPGTHQALRGRDARSHNSGMEGEGSGGPRGQASEGAGWGAERQRRRRLAEAAQRIIAAIVDLGVPGPPPEVLVTAPQPQHQQRRRQLPRAAAAAAEASGECPQASSMPEALVTASQHWQQWRQLPRAAATAPGESSQPSSMPEALATAPQHWQQRCQLPRAAAAATASGESPQPGCMPEALATPPQQQWWQLPKAAAATSGESPQAGSTCTAVASDFRVSPRWRPGQPAATVSAHQRAPPDLSGLTADSEIGGSHPQVITRAQAAGKRGRPRYANSKQWWLRVERCVNRATRLRREESAEAQLASLEGPGPQGATQTQRGDTRRHSRKQLRPRRWASLVRPGHQLQAAAAATHSGYTEMYFSKKKKRQKGCSELTFRRRTRVSSRSVKAAESGPESPVAGQAVQRGAEPAGLCEAHSVAAHLSALVGRAPGEAASPPSAPQPPPLQQLLDQREGALDDASDHRSGRAPTAPVQEQFDADALADALGPPDQSTTAETTGAASGDGPAPPVQELLDAEALEEALGPPDQPSTTTTTTTTAAAAAAGRAAGAASDRGAAAPQLHFLDADGLQEALELEPAGDCEGLGAGDCEGLGAGDCEGLGARLAGLLLPPPPGAPRPPAAQ